MHVITNCSPANKFYSGSSFLEWFFYFFLSLFERQQCCYILLIAYFFCIWASIHFLSKIYQGKTVFRLEEAHGRSQLGCVVYLDFLSPSQVVYKIEGLFMEDALSYGLWPLATQFLLPHWSEQHEETLNLINYLPWAIPETDHIY